MVQTTYLTFFVAAKANERNLPGAASDYLRRRPAYSCKAARVKLTSNPPRQAAGLSF
jgi:hypothetical protein